MGCIALWGASFSNPYFEPVEQNRNTRKTPT
jgi:hypothetical protein